MFGKFVPIICITVLVACNQRPDNQERSSLTSISPPTARSSSLPHLESAPDGNLYLSWVEQTPEYAALKYSILDEGSWSEPEPIASGKNWFVNWADYPMVTANSKGEMVAHYLAKSSAGTYSYDVNLAFRQNEYWNGPIIAHDDHTPTEHGFVTMLPLPDDRFQLVWLDGRNTGSDEGGSEGDHEGGHQGAMTLRTAVFDSEGNKSEEFELDNKTCDCCQTTGALTSEGPVVMYRDRSDAEVRDISIVRFTDGIWTEPKTVSEDIWNIAACPVNGPRADAIGNTLGVAWFTAANNFPEVKVIFSTDGGRSFADPISIDNMNPLGRVDLGLLNDTTGVVSWMGRKGSEAIIRAEKVYLNGQRGERITVAESSEARSSGFPQMEMHNGKVYFAWTGTEAGEKVIKTAVWD